MPYSRFRLTTFFGARSVLSGPGSSTAVEVEASSFSVWNAVITILLLSTVMYGAGWDPRGFTDNETTAVHYRFRALAFFFCVWALQSVALALLLVYAVGKKSYHLCHSWILCEVLMQIFMSLCAFYFAYYTYFEGGPEQPPERPSIISPTFHIPSSHHLAPDEEDEEDDEDIQMESTSFRPPKHIIFLISLHFLIKAFGFWIVKRYMGVLNERMITGSGTGRSGSAGSQSSESPYSSNRSSCVNEDPDLESLPSQTQTHTVRTFDRMSPPPSYEKLCQLSAIEFLPGYEEAVKLCEKMEKAAEADGGAPEVQKLQLQAGEKLGHCENGNDGMTTVRLTVA